MDQSNAYGAYHYATGFTYPCTYGTYDPNLHYSMAVAAHSQPMLVYSTVKPLPVNKAQANFGWDGLNGGGGRTHSRGAPNGRIDRVRPHKPALPAFSPSPVSGCISEETMQAIVLREWGGSHMLERMTVPRPRPPPGKILIKVMAAGVNQVDWKLREGNFRDLAPNLGGKVEGGVVPGWECAGVVAACGKGVNNFSVGDRVFARPEDDDWGCYAEYCVAGKRAVAHMPSSLSFEEAAAVPLAALTAYQALFDDGNLKAGQHVLVHAGSGGVGSFAIQLAVANGAIVTTTCGSKNLEYCKELGATAAIDYRSEDFSALVTDVDLVLNMTGAETATKSLACLKEGGTLVTISGHDVDADAAAAKRITVVKNWVVPDGRQLAEVAQLIDEGKVRVTIDKTFPLAKAAEAQEYQKAGVSRGKVVLNVHSASPAQPYPVDH